jgi:hypothetical protein
VSGFNIIIIIILYWGKRQLADQAPASAAADFDAWDGVFWVLFLSFFSTPTTTSSFEMEREREGERERSVTSSLILKFGEGQMWT